MASCKTPTLEYQIEVMQALADGQRVMQRVRPGHKATDTKQNELFNWGAFDYWIASRDEDRIATPEWALSVGMRHESDQYTISGDRLRLTVEIGKWTRGQIRRLAHDFGIELNE